MSLFSYMLCDPVKPLLRSIRTTNTSVAVEAPELQLPISKRNESSRNCVSGIWSRAEGKLLEANLISNLLGQYPNPGGDDYDDSDNDGKND